MDLARSYLQIKEKLDTLNFDALWKGFTPFLFALYDDERVILGDETLPKTDEFIANTAIWYRGEMVAIWKLTEPMDMDVLASKIAHEMFHAYQMERNESRFPDEMDALINYTYSPDYLTIKQRETAVLAELSEHFTDAGYQNFLSLRKRGMHEYPYQHRYECGIEVIEGSAQYVEWQTLKALNLSLYQTARSKCGARLQDIRRLMPIRALCYDTGAMLVDICVSHDLPVNLHVGDDAEYLLPENVLKKARIAPKLAVDSAIKGFYDGNIKAFREKIKTITETSRPVAQGSFKLLGVNVFSARFLDGYIYTEYFLMYEDGKPVTLYGNYLLHMENGNIAAIYEDPTAK